MNPLLETTTTSVYRWAIVDINTTMSDAVLSGEFYDTEERARKVMSLYDGAMSPQVVPVRLTWEWTQEAGAF